MMTVEVKVNGRLVATATVKNISGLADLSDYDLDLTEGASEVSGLPAFSAKGRVVGHERRQSVWALVHKIASQAVTIRQVARQNAGRK